MDAIHINWTRPFFAGGRSESEYYIEDADLLTTIISALKWRQFNGSVKLYTDKVGEAYYESMGITGIWDRGINTSVLEEFGHNMNPYVFWAAGKLAALGNEQAPCTMLDTDLIVWGSISESIKNDITVFHREELIDWVYVPRHYLNTADGYEFDESWHWDVPACNTAFACFMDNDFKNYYAGEAIRFMEGNCLHNTDPDAIRVSHMVFAEQRLLAMCAQKAERSIGTLLPNDPACWDNQQLFTHLWGHKEELRNDAAKRETFCSKCIEIIVNEFPEWVDMLYKIKPLEKYINKVNIP